MLHTFKNALTGSGALSGVAGNPEMFSLPHLRRLHSFSPNYYDKYGKTPTYQCFYHGEEGIYLKTMTVTFLAGVAG